VTTPGFFEIYPAARPPLPAGTYAATTHQDLTAAPPHGGAGDIAVDDTRFLVHIDSPRYVMPPDEILSTFPPATSQGDWSERLPQIVLKRRTLPWERNPDPAAEPEDAPPWLALVVLADGEGQLSQDVDIAQCVTPGVDLGDDADTAKGKYVEVRQSVVHKVFPCLDELDLLCHVRKVDLSDTELALGDDDGYLAVVLSSRLPQPGPKPAPDADPLPVKYTAYLVNLEHQLDTLLPTEPTPVFSFDATLASAFVESALLPPPPNASVDQIAMNLGAAQSAFAPMSLSKAAKKAAKKATQKALEQVPQMSTSTALVPYATSKGLEHSAAAWATGPAKNAVALTQDYAIAAGVRSGLAVGLVELFDPTYRYPVLVSWEFTCIGTGGFEKLMNDLKVGLLGTLDPVKPPPAPPEPPRPEVAPTGHVTLAQVTRRGDPARAWFRGPLSPQPTQRVMPTDGKLPLAHTGDQLRVVVPDGREDISRAALFEIGRLLTLSKPALVAALMQWRRDLFGAARARELANLVTMAVLPDFGVTLAGGRNPLEALVRTHLVGAFTASDGVAPRALDVTAARVPDALLDLSGPSVLAGLGASPQAVLQAAKAFGAEGLGVVTVPVAEAPNGPASADQVAMAALRGHLAARVDALTIDALKLDVAAPKGRARRSRRVDTLDRLISQASAYDEEG
jgi:hypothetical protein